MMQWFLNNPLYPLDIIGTFVFAISGALAGANKRLDYFGILAMAFFTAVGGGTIRDLLLDTPTIGWIAEEVYLLCIILGFLVALLFTKYILPLRKTFFLFDTIGIAVFTILGVQKALTYGVNEPVALLLGMVSAVMGGVIRDTLCNIVPLIFRKEVYATACLAGGALFLLLEYFQVGLYTNYFITIILIIAIRFCAVKFNWTFPTKPLPGV